jgi:hypothetical protein
MADAATCQCRDVMRRDVTPQVAGGVVAWVETGTAGAAAPRPAEECQPSPDSSARAASTAGKRAYPAAE